MTTEPVSLTASGFAGAFSAEALRLFVEKVERLEEEKKEIGDHIRDVLQEAKAQGFDPKILKQVIRIKKMKGHDRAEQEALLELYLGALGMVSGSSQ
jgi:uncharacterized protein (UPF0335 family)